jgi:phenylalanyl-tRNA synthetase beta chain
MRVPLEWLKEYVNVKKSTKDVAESFTLLGLMLDKPTDKGDVLDLEHRMDRSDWLSIIGCARDYAAFEGLELKIPKSIDIEAKKPTKDQVVNIDVKCPDIVHRFNTRVFRGISVKESPKWLKTRLEAYGIPSINNIVDITNYVMVEYGQPLHAQDLAKMGAKEIILRKAKKGEQVTTLLGETITLDTNHLVLTQNDKPTVIGAIVGGNTTGVDETTTDIVLDAGNYDQNNVRRSSRELKIQNETVLRCDKFIHPELTEVAINRASHLILELAGGEYYENMDWYPKKHPLIKLKFRLSRLKKVGGMDIKIDRVKEILSALEYKILNESEDEFEIEVPYFRTDVVVEDDIVADILRINNYAKISSKLLEMAPPKETTPKIYLFEDKLRDYLVNTGLHEHITESLVPVDEGRKEQVVLENALTSEKGALRTELQNGLGNVVRNYNKHGINEVKIFEIGNTYHVRGDRSKYENYEEIRTLQVTYSNLKLTPLENSKEVRKLLSSLMLSLGIDNYDLVKTEKGVRVEMGGEKIGHLDICCFCLLTEMLFKHSKQSNRVLSELKTYTKEDFSLIVDIDKSLGPIFNEIKKFNENILEVEVKEEYTGKGVDEGKKSILIEITYKVSGTEEIRDKLIKLLKTKHNIEIRS